PGPAARLARAARMPFTLEGRPPRTAARTGGGGAAAQPSRADDDDLLDMLPYSRAGLGVAIVGVAAVMWWRQRSAAPALVTAGAPRPRVVDNWRPPSARATKDELLQMLAALGDRYEAGGIDEHTYQERRAILMDRLVPLLNEDSDA